MWLRTQPPLANAAIGPDFADLGSHLATGDRAAGHLGLWRNEASWERDCPWSMAMALRTSVSLGGHMMRVALWCRASRCCERQSSPDLHLPPPQRRAQHHWRRHDRVLGCRGLGQGVADQEEGSALSVPDCHVSMCGTGCVAHIAFYHNFRSVMCLSACGAGCNVGAALGASGQPSSLPCTTTPSIRLVCQVAGRVASLWGSAFLCCRGRGRPSRKGLARLADECEAAACIFLWAFLA